MKRVQHCSICGEIYKGYGHNAQPINAGRCCGLCNDLVVIPERLRRFAEAAGKRE